MNIKDKILENPSGTTPHGGKEREFSERGALLYSPLWRTRIAPGSDREKERRHPLDIQ